MARPVVRTHPRRDAPQRAPLERALRVVDGALAAHAKRAGVHPVDLRQGLASAFAATIRHAFEGEVEPTGEVLLGLRGGPRRDVVLGRLRVSVSLADPPLLAPSSVTLLHRDDGVVHVAHDVGFGGPGELSEATRALGLPEGTLIGAIESVVRDLGRAEAPVAPLGAVHLPDEAGWEVFRFMQVRNDVQDPRLHISLDEARVLEPDSRPGDLLGVSLPNQDWLTPTLCWLGGAG